LDAQACRRQWQAGGQEALRSAGSTGPIPRLSDAQLAAIGQALRQGTRSHGFDTDHWTLGRIATVIERVTGVGYHLRPRVEAAAPPPALAAAAPCPPRHRA
jgi:transposase